MKIRIQRNILIQDTTHELYFRILCVSFILIKIYITSENYRMDINLKECVGHKLNTTSLPYIEDETFKIQSHPRYIVIIIVDGVIE